MSKQIRKFFRRCDAPGSASLRSLFNLTVPNGRIAATEAGIEGSFIVVLHRVMLKP
jgi:hypothetical protein